MSHITYYTFKWNLSCLPGKFKWTGNNQPTFLLHICFSSYSQLFSPRFSFCLYHSCITARWHLPIHSNFWVEPCQTSPFLLCIFIIMEINFSKRQKLFISLHLVVIWQYLSPNQSKHNKKIIHKKKKPKKQLLLPSVIPQPAYSIKAYSLVQRDLHTRVTPLSAVLWITRMPNIAWSKIHEHSLFPCIKTLEALPSKPLGWMLT